MIKKIENNIIPILLFIGLLLRIIYDIHIDILPWNDMAVWDKARISILSGKKYDVNWPPVYPLFLAAISFLFGNSYLILGITQAFISALTCFLIYLIAKNIFNNKVGLISLIISCFYIDMIWYAGVLMAETLGLFLLLTVVYLILKEKSYITTGILFGLTCLTKGVFLIALPGIIIWIWIKSNKKTVLLKIFKFTIFTFLTILPWIIRNYFEYKSFVLIEPKVSIEIFIGHNPSATGGCDYYFIEHDYGHFYKDDSLSIIEKNKIAKEIAINFACNNPAREIQLIFLKLSQYWALRTHFDFYAAKYPLRKLFFTLAILIHAVIFPLCFLGAIFSLKNKNAIGQSIIICIFTLVYITLFYASGRLRFPIVPFIIILASYGFYLLPEIICKLKTGDIKDISKKLTISVILTFLLFANFIMQIITRYKDVLNRFK